MTYHFKGKIKEIGIDINGNFCSFSAENTIKINGIDYGVAFNENRELKTIDTFREIDSNIFNLLISSQNEKMEIEFDVSYSLPILNSQFDTDSKEQVAEALFTPTIVKVAIIK